jgi:hypothetical protein
MGMTRQVAPILSTIVMLTTASASSVAASMA